MQKIKPIGHIGCSTDMEVFVNEQTGRRAGKWIARHTTGLFIGAAFGVSLVAICLIYGKWRGKILKSSASEAKPDLNMEKYIFDIATSDGIKQVTVESSGECYSVSLENSFLGTMWQDPAHGMQWKTEDQPLQEHLWDISAALSEAFSRNGFPTILKGAYPEIIQTRWKTSETLEVILKPDADLEVFSTFLQDEVMNLVDFEEHLDLVVKKKEDNYFKIIGVN